MWQTSTTIQTFDMHGPTDDPATEQLHLEHSDFVLHGRSLTASDAGRVSSLGCTQIAQAMSVAPSLTVLDLRWNAIGREGWIALAAALRTNTTLLDLRICGNRLGDSGAQILAPALTEHPTLVEFQSSKNSVGPTGAVALFTMLQHNKVLLSCSLYGNPISVGGGNAFIANAGAETAIVAMMSGNKTLRTLDVRRRNADTGNIAMLCSIAGNKTLNVLDD
jgi:hypothetical protein